MRNQRSHVSSHIACDFLLERLVHQMLRDDPRGGRELLAAALDAGAAPRWLLADILWPAVECLELLRHDGLIGRRAFSQATRTMGRLIGHLDARLPAAPEARRRLLILAAPGEPGDLGAHLLSILADASGFSALFAGAGLSREDVSMALEHLDPDALVVHGCLPESLARTAELVAGVQSGSRWPRVQTACVGAMLRNGGDVRLACDLSSHHPLEILELLALCPDHRAVPGPAAAAGLRMPAGTTPQGPADAVMDLLFSYFPPRARFN